MRAGLWWIVIGGGCKDAPPNLLVELDGAWTGTFDGAIAAVDAEATFVWSDDDEALTGEVVWRETSGERAFDLLESVSVEELGVGLALIERGGVHELYLDALAPLDPFAGAWREVWYCEQGSTGFCELSGGFTLDRR